MKLTQFLCCYFLLTTLCFFSFQVRAFALEQRPLRIIATTPDVAALLLEIGRGCVQITCLTGYNSDPRFVQGNSSDVIGLMEADLLVVTGLGLEDGWLPVLVESCRNNRINPETTGFLDLSKTIEKLDISVDQINGKQAYTVAQSYYLLDPNNLQRVALAIKERLSALSPQNSGRIEQNYYHFNLELQKKIEVWKVQLAAYQGQNFVCQNPFYDYFARHFGFSNRATIYPRHSNSVSKEQIQNIVQCMKQEKVRMIWTDPWQKNKAVKTIASKTDAEIVMLNFMPTDWQKSYIDTLDGMVTQLLKALVRVPKVEKEAVTLEAWTKEIN